MSIFQSMVTWGSPIFSEPVVHVDFTAFPPFSTCQVRRRDVFYCAQTSALDRRLGPIGYTAKTTSQDMNLVGKDGKFMIHPWYMTINHDISLQIWYPMFKQAQFNQFQIIPLLFVSFNPSTNITVGQQFQRSDSLLQKKSKAARQQSIWMYISGTPIL